MMTFSEPQWFSILPVIAVVLAIGIFGSAGRRWSVGFLGAGLVMVTLALTGPEFPAQDSGLEHPEQILFAIDTSGKTEKAKHVANYVASELEGMPAGLIIPDDQQDGYLIPVTTDYEALAILLDDLLPDVAAGGAFDLDTAKALAEREAATLVVLSERAIESNPRMIGATIGTKSTAEIATKILHALKTPEPAGNPTRLPVWFLASGILLLAVAAATDKNSKRETVLAILFLTLSANVTAQENSASETFRVTLDPKVAPLSQGVEMTLEIFEDLKRSPEIVSGKLSIRNIGSEYRTSTDVVDGIQVKTTRNLYRYVIRSDSPGRFQIPEITVTTSSGRVLNPASPVIVEFREDMERGDPEEPETGNRPVAQMTLPEQKIYAGQTIPFSVEISYPGKSSLEGFVHGSLKSEAFVVDPFSGAQQSIRDTGDRELSSLAVPNQMFALRPGRYRIDSAEFKVQALSNASVFSNSFPTFRSREIVKAEFKPVELEIHPLPAGAPDRSSISVGEFKMNAAMTPQKLRIGDVAKATISVVGTGNYRLMQVPDFSGDASGDWKVLRVTKEIHESGSHCTFSLDLIPLSNVTHLPVFEMTVFNPKVGQYQVIQTTPVALSVFGPAVERNPQQPANVAETEHQESQRSGYSRREAREIMRSFGSISAMPKTQ